MYRNLLNRFDRKSLLKVKTINCSALSFYHSDNPYYGFKPIQKKDRKSEKIFQKFI